MNTIPYNKFKHGQRLTCEIRGKKIDDAKISIDSDGTAHICQNIANGITAENNLGYRMGWTINRGEYYKDGDNGITNLQFLPRTLDELEEGDIVLKTGDEWKILGICGDVYFMSICNNFKRTGTFLTKEELEDNGYTLKQEEEGEEKESVDSAYFYITQDKNKITYDGKTYILSKYL